MPCQDPGWERDREANLDKVTRLLCSLCKALEADTANGSLKFMPADVFEWWQEHKIADREREERERKYAEESRKQKMRQFQQLATELQIPVQLPER